jgi:uncharacterized protein (DUF885 family)
MNIAVCLCFLTSIAIALPNEQAPKDIEKLFDDFFREYIELRPETGTALGVSGIKGIEVQNDELDDVSDETEDKLYRMYEKYNDWLVQFDTGKLTPEHKVACDVLKWFLKDQIEKEQFRHHAYIINPMFSFHNRLTTLMTEHHKIRTLRDAEDYIKRLEKYDKKISQLIKQIAIRQNSEIMPPIYVLEVFQEELQKFIEVPLDKSILFTSFRNRVEKLKTMKGDVKKDLYKKTLSTIEKGVYPAYTRMSEYVESLKKNANEEAGVWKLPNGDGYYEYCLKHHTTTTMSPEEVHELGLKEVKRIHDEIRMLLEALGITEGEDFRDLSAAYWELVSGRHASRYFYLDDEDGKVQTLKDYQLIIDEMGTKLPDLFSIFPKAAVRVERVPKFKEKTAGTYYEPAKLDRSTDGIFYANLSYQHFKPGMKTLTYHEAIPGHHFQIAIEQESPHSRLFRSLAHFTGYLEGWALYAEKLAKEYGFYDDVHSKLGNLRSELFRAARLVVDTGLHAKKWTREQAFDYMRNNVGWGSYGEINRYIVWPGQACAYKIGELKILELRERAQKELGGKFDIKDFHTVVLEHGSVPLEILEQLVDIYIKSGNE